MDNNFDFSYFTNSHTLLQGIDIKLPLKKISTLEDVNEFRVADGYLYTKKIISYDVCELTRIKLGNLEVMWSFQEQFQFFDLWQEHIILNSEESNNSLLFVDKETGYKTHFSEGSPYLSTLSGKVIGDRLICLTELQDSLALIRYNLKKLEIEWEKAIEADGIVLSNNKVFCNISSDSNQIYCLSLSTGEVEWEKSLEALEQTKYVHPTKGEIAISNQVTKLWYCRKMLVLQAGNKLLALNAQDGNLVWQKNDAIDVEVYEDQIYNFKTITEVLNPLDGIPLNSYKLPDLLTKWERQGIAITKDLVFMGQHPNKLLVINRVTGEFMNELLLENKYGNIGGFGDLVASGNYLFVKSSLVTDHSIKNFLNIFESS